MTSLARQLERLKVPGVQSKLGLDTRRVSLIFDSKEAANEDRLSVYQLGKSGLDELHVIVSRTSVNRGEIQERFDVFNETLFSSSADFQRSVQTREINEKLNETIRAFLVEISAYLYMKPTVNSPPHKALEWLVYRYQIYEYNIDDLLMCAMPHHDTESFIRILKMISLDDPKNKWHWLQPVVKSGVPLSRKTLINHARANMGFLHLICDLPLQFISNLGVDSKEQLRAVIALFTTVSLGVLQRRVEIKEDVVSVIVHSVTAALKSECVDLKAASYMILSQLCVSATLGRSVVKSLLKAVTKNIDRSLSKEAFACISLIVHTQQVEELSSRILSNMCSVPRFSSLLAGLSTIYNIQAILRAVLKTLIPAAVPPNGESMTESGDRPCYFGLLRELLESLDLDVSLADDVTQQLVEHLATRRCVIAGDNEALEGWLNVARPLMAVVERRWSESLQRATESLQHNEQLHESLHELLSLTLLPARYEVVPELSTTLVLALNHADVARRLLAVRHLVTKIQSRTLAMPAELVAELLLKRLKDDSPDVVSAVLGLNQDLVVVTERTVLVESLLAIINARHGNSEWADSVNQCISLIGSRRQVPDPLDVAYRLLPWLLLTKRSDVTAMRLIIESDAVRSEPLYRCLADDVAELLKRMEVASFVFSSNGLAEANMLIVERLADGLVQMSPDDYLRLVTVLVQYSMLEIPRVQFLLTCVLADVLGRLSSDRSVQLTVLFDAVNLIEKMLITGCASNSSSKKLSRRSDPATDGLASKFAQWLKHFGKHGVVAESLVVWNLSHVLDVLKTYTVADLREGATWVSPDELLVKVVAKLFDIIVPMLSSSEQWTSILNRLNQEFDKSLLLRILSSLLAAELANAQQSGSHLRLDVTVAVLDVAHCVCVDGSETSQSAIIDSPLIPCLLAYIVCDVEPLRQSSLRTLRVALKTCSDKLSSYQLLRRVTKKKSETGVVSDAAYASQVLARGIVKLSASPAAAAGTGAGHAVDELVGWCSADKTPLVIKLHLLQLLRGAPHQLVLPPLIPLAESMLNRSEGLLSIPELAFIDSMLERYDSVLAPSLTPSSQSFALLLSALKAGKQTAVDDKTVQLMAIGHINGEFFAALPNVDSQRQIVSTLVNIVLATQRSQSSSCAVSCLKQLKLNSQQVVHEINAETDSTSDIAVRKGAKKTRIEKPAGNMRHIDSQRVAVILEAIQSRKKFTDIADMTSMLFNLLTKLMQEEMDDVDYCIQLTLVCLHNVCRAWSKQPTHPELMNVEVLVQCIRNIASPQIQQQALLVLTAVAPLFPEYMLHNAMSIFTFVGGNLVQQDDAYSFQLITQTINAIIPALIKAFGVTNELALNKLTVDVVSVFVGARHHIPRHRSLLLFRELLHNLGVEKTLGITGTLLIESAVRTRDVPTVELDGSELDAEKQSSIDKDIDFAVNIFSQFSSTVQLRSVTNILIYLHELLHIEGKDKSMPKSRVELLLSSAVKRVGVTTALSVKQVLATDTLTSQQLRIIKYSLSKLVTALLSNKVLVAQVVEILTADGEQQPRSDLESTLEQLLVQTVCYVTAVSRFVAAQQSSVSSKFWKSLEHRALEVLEKVNYLLPTTVFVARMTSLLNHEAVRVREKSHALLNARLRQLAYDKLSSDEVSQLSELVNQLTVIIRRDMTELSQDGSGASTGGGGATHTVCQLALIGLQLLCRLLGEHDSKLFIARGPASVIDAVVELLALESLRSSCPLVLANALLYVAEFCSVVKKQTIPVLPLFMPTVVKIGSDLDLLFSQESILVSLLIVLQKTLSNLPQFLSQYLNQMILSVCAVSTSEKISRFDSKSQVVVRLTAVKRQLAESVSTRVFVSKLPTVYSELLKTNQRGVRTLLEIVTEHATCISRDDLNVTHNPLWLFYCQQLINIRNDCHQLTLDEMEQAEDGVIDAVLSTVLRLPETDFKSVKFSQLVGAVITEDDDIGHNRRLTFYRICVRLVSRLQSLFVPLVSQMLKDACKILKRINSSSAAGDEASSSYFGEGEDGVKKRCCLLDAVIDCLHKCLLYNREDKDNTHDVGGLFTIDCMKAVMPSLVDQLGNCLGGQAETERRISELIVPCIAQLAAECHRDGSALRHLNDLVCRKTKPIDSSAYVRFAALKVIEEMVRKLGDTFKVLLPETIVTLNELHEDESEEVEQQCQQVMTLIEEQFGDIF